MYDLVIIHSQDTTPWTEYILGYLDKEDFNMKISLQRDIDLLCTIGDRKTRSAIVESKAVIVIVSPVHLQFLIENSQFSYSGLVADVRRAQLFLCGTKLDDFYERDLDGAQISERFPDFELWKKLPHDKHVQLLTNAMILMEAELETTTSHTTSKTNGSNGKRRRKKNFEITPNKARCEEPTIITLLFSEIIADSAKKVDMEIVFGDNSPLPIKIAAKWCNPYAYQFIAPPHSAGRVKFTVTDNGTNIGSKCLDYFSLESDIVTGIMQVYIHQIARLCRYFHDRDVDSSTINLDCLLSELLNEDFYHSIPPIAFEEMFATYRYLSCEKKSSFEFPTLLHLAAKFGLHEFSTKLIDLPLAEFAYRIKNNVDEMPEQIARNNGYSELGALFQDFHVFNDTINSVYESYLPEIQLSNRLSAASDLSTTPTAVRSSGSEDTYIDMTGLCKMSEKEKTENVESDLDEDSYFVMDQPEILHAIENRIVFEQQHLEQRQKEEEEEQRRIEQQQQEEQQEKIQHQQQLQKRQQQHQQGSTQVSEKRTTADNIEEEDISNVSDLPESQMELIEIMSQVVEQKMSMFDGECMIKEWKLRHNHGRSKSFKEKQMQLSKMRDQMTKAKEKLKEPSWFNSVFSSFTKKSSIHPFIVASSFSAAAAAAVETTGRIAPTSTDRSSIAVARTRSKKISTIRYPTESTEHTAPSVKTRKFLKKTMKNEPNVEKDTSLEIESTVETAQRNSNASASSRESVLSVTSRTSTSSGVDIDTVDEEHLSEHDSKGKNFQPSNIYEHIGGRSKRKSRNLEILQEELSCSDAPAPPPLPPRMNIGLNKAGRLMVASIEALPPPLPSSPRPTRRICEKREEIQSVSLPPTPRNLMSSSRTTPNVPPELDCNRKRSSSEGNIMQNVPAIQNPLAKPSWKSFDTAPSSLVLTPPPRSPITRIHTSHFQRRPAPPTPLETKNSLEEEDESYSKATVSGSLFGLHPSLENDSSSASDLFSKSSAYSGSRPNKESLFRNQTFSYSKTSMSGSKESDQTGFTSSSRNLDSLHLHCSDEMEKPLILKYHRAYKSPILSVVTPPAKMEPAEKGQRSPRSPRDITRRQICRTPTIKEEETKTTSVELFVSDDVPFKRQTMIATDDIHDYEDCSSVIMIEPSPIITPPTGKAGDQETQCIGDFVFQKGEGIQYFGSTRQKQQSSRVPASPDGYLVIEKPLKSKEKLQKTAPDFTTLEFVSLSDAVTSPELPSKMQDFSEASVSEMPTNIGLAMSQSCNVLDSEAVAAVSLDLSPTFATNLDELKSFLCCLETDLTTIEGSEKGRQTLLESFLKENDECGSSSMDKHFKKNTKSHESDDDRPINKNVPKDLSDFDPVTYHSLSKSLEMKDASLETKCQSVPHVNFSNVHDEQQILFRSTTTSNKSENDVMDTNPSLQCRPTVDMPLRECRRPSLPECPVNRNPLLATRKYVPPLPKKQAKKPEIMRSEEVKVQELESQTQTNECSIKPEQMEPKILKEAEVKEKKSQDVMTITLDASGATAAAPSSTGAASPRARKQPPVPNKTSKTTKK